MDLRGTNSETYIADSGWQGAKGRGPENSEQGTASGGPNPKRGSIRWAGASDGRWCFFDPVAMGLAGGGGVSDRDAECGGRSGPCLLLPGALNDNPVSPESRSPTTHLPRGITRRSGITRMLPKTDGAPQRPARWVHQCLVQHRERVTCRIDQCLRPGSIVAKQAEWMLGIVRIRDHVLGNGSRRPRLRHII